MAAHCDVMDNNKLESDEEWIEPEDDHGICDVKCLFCVSVLDSAEKLFSHCETEHGFLIEEIKAKHNLDAFSYIKFVNFIRSKGMPAEDVKSIESSQFNDDDYMKPHIEDDMLLMFDIESIGPTEDEGEVMQQEEDLSVESKLALSEKKMEEISLELKRTTDNFQKLRSFSQTLIMSQPSNGNHKDDDGYDEPYFESYSHFGIHLEMLSDSVRTKAYKDAVLNNVDSIRDKIVLDVGCGTGILSMFCASSGASKVIAVDHSDILSHATAIINENNMANKIQFIKGKLEDVKLPVSQVDIIISEWMGYFLLFECMLETIIHARKKHLKSGGLIFPDRCNISLVGVSDMEYYSKNVSFWEDVYGYKMTCMKKDALKEGSIEVIKKESIVTDSFVVKEFDMYECEVEDIEFTSEFNLVMKEAKPITAIVGYFDTFFEKNLQNKVHFSTSPDSPPTHWKQTVFCLPEPLEKEIGADINGKIKCSRLRSDPRSLKIDLFIESKKYVYFLQ